MRLILLLGAFLFLSIACSKQSGETSSVFIVKVNDEILTKEELEATVPEGLSPEDSTIAAEHYIRMWINNNLMYDVASQKVADKKSIEQLVDNYRQSLTIYQYKEQLVSEKLSKEINNQILLDYYESNKNKFKIDKSLIKGLYLKIPLNAPQIDKVRNWYKTITPANITNIENYCVRNAVEYGYFVDNWVDFNELTEEWPVNYKNESDVIKVNKYFEQKGSKYYYFLHVTDYSLPGDNAPFEYAKSTIKEILINQQKIDFLKKIEEDLYRKALDKGQIIFYSE
ncbi:MAG: peptidyl-prolyl cis-trans isomerase [Dysgonamonadaceae bacterium]|jgi:hypothetical protein|nr:peptidyl-prolyl cis-trans isomerase [Dysgonamonadaceae bacterium]